MREFCKDWLFRNDRLLQIGIHTIDLTITTKYIDGVDTGIR